MCMVCSHVQSQIAVSDQAARGLSTAMCVRAGAAVCDKRRDIAYAEQQFPGIDFSHIERGPDVVYEQHKVESEHAVMERGARFLQWLMARCAD